MPGHLGQARTEPERRKADGVGILERTRTRDGWGAAGGSSERTFGAPRPVLNPGQRQRDMKREDLLRRPGAAVREMSFRPSTVRVVSTEVEP